MQEQNQDSKWKDTQNLNQDTIDLGYPQDQDPLYLTKKPKKGILRIVFSRIGIMLVLFVVQINIMLAIYHWFSGYFRQFAAVQFVFSVVMVLYLFNCSMDASAKLTWLNLIMLFPVPATIMLYVVRKDIGQRMINQHIIRLIDESRGEIKQKPGILEAPELINSGTDDLCHYLNRSGTFPIYQNTQVEFYPSGEAKFTALLEELKKAKEFIFMEYFIIGEGYMWGSILRILAQKAEEGVDVRILYDGMCEVSLLPHNYPKRMAKLGIKCKPYTPISPFITTQYNYRDHRKIVVIDGKVAFNGGVNLADEYINRVELHGHWKDTAVKLTGEAVQSFTLMFLQMWNLDERSADWKEAKISYPAPTDGYVMPYADCPLDQDKVGESVYMDILYRAKHYVHIMTPYLILDNELEAALKYAAERGVEVCIIMPGIPDKKSPYALAKTHYRTLVNSGVKIYEYTPGFVHAKIFVSDDEKAVVGTINLDYRSLYHHFECATYLYQTSCVKTIEADYQETLKKCRLVTLETIKKEKLYYKVLGVCLKILAPLM